MCGIIGCVSEKAPVRDLLIRGLKRLEYRGYDSAGIAVESASGMALVREVGKIQRLEDAVGGFSSKPRRASDTPDGPPTGVRARPMRIRI